MLRDNHGRTINYLRLAVTDRCNLRCFYCMPEEGLSWLSRRELMTYEEMVRICSLLVNMGVDKIRITGGEPFVRRDMMPFLSQLSRIPGLQELSITTNGVLTAPHVGELKKIGVRSVNLSLDTLDRERFLQITHRDELERVLQTLDALLLHGLEVKVNAVVMEGRNTDDILPMVELTKHLPLTVRFIEEMPFNGDSHSLPALAWDYRRILDEIKSGYPLLEKIPDPRFSTAYHYQVPGFRGRVGLIAAYSRTFCGTCNRLRITPQGMLKTCLYDGGVFNIRDFIREGGTDTALKLRLLEAFAERAKDGVQAEQARTRSGQAHESMATIGG